jgi:hypothetical protein
MQTPPFAAITQLFLDWAENGNLCNLRIGDFTFVPGIVGNESTPATLIPVNRGEAQWSPPAMRLAQVFTRYVDDGLIRFPLVITFSAEEGIHSEYLPHRPGVFEKGWRRVDMPGIFEHTTPGLGASIAVLPKQVFYLEGSGEIVGIVFKRMD